MRVNNQSFTHTLSNLCDIATVKTKKSNKMRYYLDGDYAGIYITRREREVLLYLMQGYTTKEIANHSYISIRTAEDHIANLRNKLGFSRKQEMVRALLSQGYLHTLLDND